MNLVPILGLLLILNCCEPPRQAPPSVPPVIDPLPEETQTRHVKDIMKEQPPSKVEDKSIPGKTDDIQQSVDKAWSAAVRYQHIIKEDTQ